MCNDVELKQRIEAARKELDEAIECGEYQIAYEKSKQLDKLIEEYIEKSIDCE